MSRVKGFKGARARARRRPDELDAHVEGAIAETVEAVHRTGRSNIDAMVKRRSGLLRRRYRKQVRGGQLAGVVGYISASARRAAFYARFVHDGTKYAAARPFHDLSVAQHAASHSRRMHRALRTIAGPSGLARNGRGRVRGV